MGAVATVSLAAPQSSDAQDSDGILGWAVSVQPPPLPSSFYNLAQISLPSPLGDGGKGDSWCGFLGYIPVAAPKGSMVCGTHLGQPEQQVRKMMVAVLTHIRWGFPRPEISPCSQEHPHRLHFPLPQVTVLCSQQLEDLLVLGLGQKFCNCLC